MNVRELGTGETGVLIIWCRQVGKSPKIDQRQF